MVGTREGLVTQHAFGSVWRLSETAMVRTHGKGLVARLFPRRLECLRRLLCPARQHAGYEMDKVVCARACIRRKQRRESVLFIPPELRVGPLPSDYGHHAVALEHVAERAGRDADEDDLGHQPALQSETRTTA